MVRFGGSGRDYAILADLERAIYPEWAAAPSQIEAADRNKPAYCRHRRWFVVEGDQAVGYAGYSTLVWANDPHQFVMTVALTARHVGPAWGAVHQAVLDQITPFEPRKLITFTFSDRTDERAAITGAAYYEETTYPRSELDVSTFEPGDWHHVVDGYWEQGYGIKTAVELAETDPEFERKLYALCMEIDEDMPTPVVFTPPPFEVWRGFVFSPASYLPDAFFVAVDGDTYIGLASLRGPTPDPERLNVGKTGLARAYRRRGVATRLKLSTVAYALDHGVRFLWTDNEQTNPMYGINMRLGFAARPAEHEFHRSL